MHVETNLKASNSNSAMFVVTVCKKKKNLILKTELTV